MPRLFDDEYSVDFYRLHTLNYDQKISLYLAIELLCGKCFYDRSKVPSDPRIMVVDDLEFSQLAISIYEKALKAIKTRTLHAETETNDSGFPETVYHEMPKAFKYVLGMGPFLKWAINKRLVVEENLLTALGIFQCKDRIRKRVLQQRGAAQVAWHIDSSQTVEDLLENPIMKRWEPTEGYGTLKNFRRIVGIVDPRPKKFKTKKTLMPRLLSPFPPKMPYDTLSYAKNGERQIELFKIETICKTILKELKFAFPEVSGPALSHHPLIRLYFGGSTDFLERILGDWISEL